MFVVPHLTSVSCYPLFLQVDRISVYIFSAVAFIGVVTFCFSVAGVKIGNVFGTRYKTGAELAGGVILILLGIKILLEHLGIL